MTEQKYSMTLSRSRRFVRHAANKRGRHAGKGRGMRINVVEVGRIVRIIEAVLKLIESFFGL